MDNNQRPVILALTDGKAGHETQTQGIIQLLNQQQQYQVEWLKLNLPSKWQYRILKWLLKFSPNTAWLARFMSYEQLDNIMKKKVAYIISAGGNTLLPNALLKLEFSKKQAVKNIVASSLRGIKASYFDVVFTIDINKQGIKPFVYYPIAPNKMLSFNLEDEKKRARQVLELPINKVVISILIGADTKEVQIGTINEWIVWLQHLVQQSPENYYIISTSRRTLKEFELALKESFAFTKNVKQILVGLGNNQPIQDVIYASNMVICSPDSTSMISEGLIAGKKLFVPLFEHSKLNDNFKKYYFQLEQDMPLSCSQVDTIVDFNTEELIVSNHAQNLEQAFKKNLNE